MYTVFDSEGPKVGRFGLIIFVRTRAEALAQCEPGDAIVRWGSGGHPSGVWERREDGRMVRTK